MKTIEKFSRMQTILEGFGMIPFRVDTPRVKIVTTLLAVTRAIKTYGNVGYFEIIEGGGGIFGYVVEACPHTDVLVEAYIIPLNCKEEYDFLLNVRAEFKNIHSAEPVMQILTQRVTAECALLKFDGVGIFDVVSSMGRKIFGKIIGHYFVDNNFAKIFILPLI
jgi:hypothetical protein